MTDPKLVVIDYSDIKHKWLGIYRGEDAWLSQPGMNHFVEVFTKKIENPAWYGGTPDQMAYWLEHGFQSDDFKMEHGNMPMLESRRMVFAEDGELDLTLAWSGHDYPYLAWEQQKRKPGVRIIADLDYNGTVNAKTIAQYGTWLCAILSNLEAQGYDIELDIRTRGVNFSPQYNGQIDILCRVKRENEFMDFTEFSPLFSPTGFRFLFFTMFGMAMDSLGYKISNGLGKGIGNKFDISYDPETSILDIQTNANASHFPEEEMTNKLRTFFE